MTTTNNRIDAKHTKGSTSFLLILILIAVVGVGAWVYQLTQGMRVTGLNQQVVWAFYIAAFFSAVGAGAGLLFLVGLSEFKVLIPADHRRHGLMAVLGSFVAGGLLIMLDIGNPIQVWRIITAGRFSSMMTWDFWLLIVAGLVAVTYLFLTVKSGPRKLLGALAMVSSVAVVVVEGWMLSSLSSRPLWDGGITVVSFLLAGLLAGLALVILISTDTSNKKIKEWLQLVLIASLVVVVAEIVTRLVGGLPRSTDEIASLVISGTAAPTFWFQILAGLVLPLALLLSGKYSKIAAILVLLGVLAEKSWLLVAGQAYPWLPLSEGKYFFTLTEVVAVAGVVAIGILIYIGLQKVLVKSEE